MALDTVADYVTEARTLLQDTVDSPYRYSNASLVSALNIGILTARRLRPDLFLSGTIPSFVEADIAANTAFDMDEQYRTPFLYFLIGHAQLRDEEDTQDARAGAFISKFTAQLTVLA